MQSANPGLHEAITHVPAPHPGVPFATKHAIPQPPQFCGSFVIVVSHPFPAFPSQSPLPARHWEYVQLPPAHAGTPPWAGHGLLHAPQLATLVCVFTSQPFAAFMSQSAKPALQVIPHMPERHAGWALAAPAQVLPHVPQLAVLCAVFTSQPSAALLLQSAYVPVHAKPQVPIAQVALAFAGLGQALPHIPQLSGSVSLETQAPLQLVRPGPQVMVQAPALHTRPAPHAWLHVPQFAGSLFVSVHVPLQSVSVPEHTQAPFTQLVPPAQGWLHMPQLALSVCGSMQPLPQSICAPGQPASVPASIAAPPVPLIPPLQPVPLVPPLPPVPMVQLLVLLDDVLVLLLDDDVELLEDELLVEPLLLVDDDDAPPAPPAAPVPEEVEDDVPPEPQPIRNARANVDARRFITASPGLRAPSRMFEENRRPVHAGASAVTSSPAP